MKLGANCGARKRRWLTRLVATLWVGGLASLCFGAPSSPLTNDRPGPARAQSSKAQSSKAQNAPPSKRLPKAVQDIEKNIRLASLAKDHGDPQQIVTANRQLAASCLRALAQLHMLKGPGSDAIALYQQSLAYEDTSDTRADLAIAEMNAGKMQDAVKDAEQATVLDPRNARAWGVKGKIAFRVNQPELAITSYQHSAEIAPTAEAMYSLGRAYLTAKKKDQADAVFAQMAKLFGESGSLHVLFARGYRDQNYLEEAVENLKIALKLDPRTPHAHYLLGLTYLTLHEWAPSQEARSALLEELKYSPNDYLTAYLLGVMSSTERRYDESDRFLKIAARAKPEAHESWLYLGLNAFSQGKPAEAETLLRKAIALSANHESEAHYLVRKGYIALGRILSSSGRSQEAAGYFKKAREFQNLSLKESTQSIAEIKGEAARGDAMVSVPESAEQTAAAKDFDGSAGTDTPGALPVSPQQSADAAAGEAYLRHVLGGALQDIGTGHAITQQFREALGYYREAEHWDSDLPGIASNLGLAAFYAGEYQEAIRPLAKAIAANPGDMQARGALGIAYYGDGAYASAAKTFAPMGQRGMQDPGMGYAWAASLVKLGEFKNATQVLLVLEKAPLTATGCVLVGRLWDAMGDYSRAVEAFYRGLKLDPSLAKAHFSAGIAYLHRADFGAAVNEFTLELQRNPDDAEAAYDLGYAHLQQSQNELAESIFRQVVTSHPQHAMAQYQLGKILLDQGKVEEAVSHLEASTRLDPDADFPHYVLQLAYRKLSRKQDADRELELYRAAKARSREKTIPRPVESR